MVWLSIVLACISIMLLVYIYKLHQELHAHEENWINIEELTDHNKDGDIVIHCRHQEENKTDGI